MKYEVPVSGWPHCEDDIPGQSLKTWSEARTFQAEGIASTKVSPSSVPTVLGGPRRGQLSWVRVSIRVPDRVVSY